MLIDELFPQDRLFEFKIDKNEQIWENSLSVLDEWIHAGAFYLSPKEQKDAIPAFKLIKQKIPPQKIPQTIYRGLVLKKSLIKKILNDASLDLKPKLISSWTADPQIALKYAQSYDDKEMGVIISIPTPTNALLFIDQALIKKILKIKLDFDQKEVVLEGTGINSIKKQNILALVDDHGNPIRPSDFIT